MESVKDPVTIPSAARGALEAIFWKQEMTWEIAGIWVLNPIRYISSMCNEIESRSSLRLAL